MHISLPYGDSVLESDISRGRHLGTLDIADANPIQNIEKAVQRALTSPIGMSQDIFSIVQPEETVAILVSDAFRHTGIHLILPTLVEGLNQSGIRDEDILFVFACGTHRPPTEEEKGRILGQTLYERFRAQMLVHDPLDEDNLLYVGTTSRGTPVRVNRRVQDCDRVIVTGAVVLHYFGGYGGGRKSILPGISSVETIAHNHALNLDPIEDRLNPAVRIGALDGNPVAEDMFEAIQFTKVDYLINTILNRSGEIAAIFAGDIDAAHRTAAKFAHELFAVPINHLADLVIASAGNPKNFIQSHKALFNAYQAVKPGGRIILTTPCPEGFGGETFAQWLRLGDRKAIINELRNRAEINGQTALSTIEKAPITTFITELSEQQVALLGGRKASTLSEALDIAHNDLIHNGVPEPRYYTMPSASYTVPFFTGSR
ncbi:MAG TPA: nickel-dependent lactate racemase [Candidatus Hydrogenedentes bacterium]|nr:nickel-dependent lactate racemase [Candidatus Hydrogenedentota bacterium]